MQGFIRPKEDDDMEIDSKPVVDYGPFNFFTGIQPTKVDSTAYEDFPMKYFRPVSSHTGLLTNPHGSTKLFQGDTCVVAAVYGPTEVRISKELPERGAVDVLFRPKVTGMSQMATPVMDPIKGERSVENILISIFESSIHLEEISGLGYNIIVHEFEDDGNLLSACINAITIALLDGGCSLRFPVAGVTLILTRDNKLIIDPSSNQMKEGYQVKFTYAMSNGMDILYTNVQGQASSEMLKIAQAEACEAAGEMFRFFHFLALKKNRTIVHSRQNEIVSRSKVKIEVGYKVIDHSSSEHEHEDGELSGESDD